MFFCFCLTKPILFIELKEFSMAEIARSPFLLTLKVWGAAGPRRDPGCRTTAAWREEDNGTWPIWGSWVGRVIYLLWVDGFKVFWAQLNFFLGITFYYFLLTGLLCKSITISYLVSELI